MVRAGLTTTKAPFIEEAKSKGEVYIRQPYELYSEENQEAWRLLYARLLPRWEKYANPKFLEGVTKLALPSDRIPRLEDVNKFLAPLTGFEAKAVSGYIPPYIFFDCLRNRAFPTTITIRDINTLDYLPEPDIFHDVAGHVPMHTDRRFADVLVRFGEAARTASQVANETKDEKNRLRIIGNIVKAMARFFWFTIEFGLMRGKNGATQVYGSGLLSSYGEIEYCVESPEVQRVPMQLDWVVNQYFEIHHYQPLLFTVDSFDHLFDEIGRLEEWMKEGKLNNVSPGEPNINEQDLKEFLGADVVETVRT
ncbi:MAG: phenylalanine 4-monooxygenase [Armatimonadetes bacterium]|nr:phenylalanine 4-monooxygenase [Armatimonadota bacterium]